MLTKNQEIIYIRLLYLLGFDNFTVREKYLKELSKNLEVERIYWKLTNEYIFKSPVSEQDMVLNRDKIFDHITDYKPSSYVSASEIADFSFCPASFCIGKSFKKIETNEAKLGADLHLENRLVTVAKKGERSHLGQNAYAVSMKNEKTNFFFADVSSSDVVYLGHLQEAENLFSSKGNFVGQPDYILKNKNGQDFIIEEKFRYIKQLNSDSNARQNHKLQLASYIYGLDSVNATYGCLVYWSYDFFNEKPIVQHCNVFKVEKNQQFKLEITNIYKDIIKLKSGHEISFNVDNLNPVKCVKCSVAKFCSHKTGTIAILSLPYSEKFFSVKKYSSGSGC